MSHNMHTRHATVHNSCMGRGAVCLQRVRGGRYINKMTERPFFAAFNADDSAV